MVASCDDYEWGLSRDKSITWIACFFSSGKARTVSKGHLGAGKTNREEKEAHDNSGAGEQHTERRVMANIEQWISDYSDVYGSPKVLYVYSANIPCLRDGELGMCTDALIELGRAVKKYGVEDIYVGWSNNWVDLGVTVASLDAFRDHNEDEMDQVVEGMLSQVRDQVARIHPHVCSIKEPERNSDPYATLIKLQKAARTVGSGDGDDESKNNVEKRHFRNN